MNGKLVKEIRSIIREEMPAILAEEQNKAHHIKLAAEMREIVSEIVPKLLSDAQHLDVYTKVSADIKKRLDEIDKYLKETNEHKTKRLEETLLAFAQKDQPKSDT
jgi:hypothetical protein